MQNKYNVPKCIVDAMSPRPYSPCGLADYSATSLIRSPRQVQLEKRHSKEIKAGRDVPDVWAFWRGNAIHKAVEDVLSTHFPEEYLIERKITRHDMGKRVVAKLDAYDIQERKMIDHKTGRLGNQAGSKDLWMQFKDDWKHQLMINKYFLEMEGYPVDTLAINNFFLDWSPGTARMKSADEYPKAPIVEILTKAPSFQECKAYYEERLKMHIAAEDLPDAELPACTPEDCWESPAIFAIESRNTGKSRKNCPSYEVAVEWMNQNLSKAAHQTYHIVKRPQRRTKCEMWCDAAPFCNQWKEFKNA